ncbi:hypothetical protein HPB47_028044 [Ixodes persulcatus]|uniref:Uncharacterized protein n=1 Tax=Ixodes persulcatus TaxID=34615 RepID=A0AC60PUV2_IXOPE|nr:hypothetical protein HPB47_028044 [Ixodes persulcatus]
MFSSSTQSKRWIFLDEQQISRRRQEANERFIERHLDECRSRGTSFHYFKRFYLNNSVMDYHPKHMLVTCVYLACKVEEFNVSIAQFVNNVRGDREKATDIILNNELLLMQQLEYHLTIHNPYRPLEGLLIDIKTRCPQFPDPEKLRSLMDDFLERTLFTDAVLLMAPSQIALTAVLYAANKAQANSDVYVTDILFAGCSHDKLHHIKDAVKTFHKTMKVKGQEYQLKLVDTAGQDEYSIFPQSYSMDIHGYVLVYSINSTKRFEVVRGIWKGVMVPGLVPIVLVGNKVDLRVERVVSYEEGRQAADYMKAAFLEASAKQNQARLCSLDSVFEIFSTMIQQIDWADGNVPEKQSCVVS